MHWLYSDAAVSHFTFSDAESSENVSALACQYEMRCSVPAFEDDIDVLHSNLAASCVKTLSIQVQNRCQKEHSGQSQMRNPHIYSPSKQQPL